MASPDSHRDAAARKVAGKPDKARAAALAALEARDAYGARGSAVSPALRLAARSELDELRRHFSATGARLQRLRQLRDHLLAPQQSKRRKRRKVPPDLAPVFRSELLQLMAKYAVGGLEALGPAI